MTVTVSPTDPRSVRALAVLATADRWVKGHRKADGRAFFAIPGSNGRIYFTDTRDCSCPDQRQRDETCKHILGVRLWALQHAATPPAPSQGPATADDGLGLASDIEIDAAFAEMKVRHVIRDAVRADRLARYRRELGLVEV